MHRDIHQAMATGRTAWQLFRFGVLDPSLVLLIIIDVNNCNIVTQLVRDSLRNRCENPCTVHRHYTFVSVLEVAYLRDQWNVLNVLRDRIADILTALKARRMIVHVRVIGISGSMDLPPAT